MIYFVCAIHHNFRSNNTAILTAHGAGEMMSPGAVFSDRKTPLIKSVSCHLDRAALSSYASSEDENLQEGSGCAGTTWKDAIGATFNRVYNGS